MSYITPQQELSSVIGVEAARDFYSGSRLIGWSVGTIVVWIIATLVFSASHLLIAALFAIILGICGVIPISIFAFAKGSRLQGRATTEAAAFLDLPEGRRVITPILRRGPESIRRYAAHVKLESNVPQTVRQGLEQARRAVPKLVWFQVIVGLVFALAGVALSITTMIMASFLLTQSNTPSPVWFMGAAVLCYIVGIPLMYSYVRYTRKLMRHDE